MPITINNLAEFDPHYENNDTRGRLLAHAGCDYFSLCLFLQAEMRRESGAWLTNAELPLMHQTLELFAKAIGALVDAETPPRAHGHKVRQLMERYQELSPAFSRILSDDANVQILDGLENAYLSIRYGESAFSTSADVTELFNEMVDDLMAELRELTGLRLPIWELCSNGGSA